MPTDLRHYLLRRAYRFFPFDLKGDAEMTADAGCSISCLIPTFDRLRELSTILDCLQSQDMNRADFEVIVVDDGSNPLVANLCRKYESAITVIYLSISQRHSVGSLRNAALAVSRGEILLFLDDDTQLWNTSFLSIVAERFASMPAVGCLQFMAEADRCLLNHRYAHLDGHSFAMRCVAYRREHIFRLGGLMNVLTSYEDIELSLRFVISGGKCCRDAMLSYFHPPLYFPSWQKPLANGHSFLKLRHRYSYVIWFLCFMNAIRFLPFMLSPSIRQRQWGKISAGFLLALFVRQWGNRAIIYR